MYLEDGFSKGGGGFGGGPVCKVCRRPILKGEASTHIRFDGDPHAMSGEYHLACSKPFDSLARAVNMMGRFGL